MPSRPEHVATSARMARLAALASANIPSLKLIYDTAPIGLAFLSPDCRYLQINQHLTEICGISVEEHLGRSVRECVPALGDSVEAIVRSIMETGEPVTGVEVASQRSDVPFPRSWITYWHPVHDLNNEIIGVNVAAEEITERKQAEAALRSSEQQFRTLADAIPQLVWMSEGDGRIFWFNNQLSAFAASDAIGGQDWLTVLDPDAGRELWTASLETGEPMEMELNLRGKDGEPRVFLTRIVPLQGPPGARRRWIGTHIDISEMKQREAHIRFIADEVSHRSKNLLTVVMAIAQRTAQQADDVGQYLAQFSGRLTALAQCQDLLVKDRWYGAPFSDLVAAQLKPFGEIDQGRITAEGPPLILLPNAVQHLGLAIHELATNASKHGALAGGSGRVAIRWRLDEETRTVRLDWLESGGPSVVPPRRKGFGTVVIQKIVPQALNGSGSLDYRPEGVSWTFEFPAQECEVPRGVS